MTGAPGWDPDTVTVLWCEVAGDERRRAHCVAVRAAARLVGAAARAVHVAHEPDGRPVLSGAVPGPQISLSHGRGAVAVALGGSSRLRLGVDVEVVRPVRATALADRYLAPAEARWLDGLDEAERGRAFLWLWTQKEAVGKALGCGLRGRGMSRPVPLPAAWPPGTDDAAAADGRGPTLCSLPDDPATASAAFLAADGRLVVSVAAHHPDRTEPVRIRVRRAGPADGFG
jgi:4'-phosphopantetheinyl transferase